MDIELSDLRASRRSPAEPTSNARMYQGAKRIAICAALYTSCFLYGLDTTIAAAIQGPVVEAFGHVEQLSWVGAGAPLGAVCVVLLFANLFNTFNMKVVYIASVAVFLAGLVLCCAAPNMNTLIVGRVVVGVGGGGIHLGSLQYFTIMTADRERWGWAYMGLIAAFWGLGCIVGPVIGGAFAVSAAGWRWAFYVNCILTAVCGPALIFLLPSLRVVGGMSVRDTIARIDFLGFVLGSGMWVCFLLAITMTGRQWPWPDNRTITTLVLWLDALVLYGLQQGFCVLTRPANRAFPAHLLRQCTQVLLSIATAAATGATSVMIYYLPLFFQFVNGDSAFMAGVYTLPFLVVAVFMNIFSETLLSFIKSYKVQFLIASGAIVLGGGALTHNLSLEVPIGTIHGLSILAGIGCGLSMGIGYTIASLSATPDDTAAALKLQVLAQIGGPVIALGVAGQLYRYRAVASLQSALEDHGYSYSEIWDLVSGTQSTLFQKLNGTLQNGVITSITSAMQMTIAVVPAAGGIIFVAALLMKYEFLYEEPSPFLFPRS